MLAGLSTCTYTVCRRWGQVVSLAASTSVGYTPHVRYPFLSCVNGLLSSTPRYRGGSFLLRIALPALCFVLKYGSYNRQRTGANSCGVKS